MLDFWIWNYSSTRNQAGLGYWLMLHTSFVFSPRCWTPKIYGRGQSPSLHTSVGWHLTLQSEVFIVFHMRRQHVIRTAKMIILDYFQRTFILKYTVLGWSETFIVKQKHGLHMYEPYWLLHGQIHLSMQQPAHCSLQLLYTLTLPSSWSMQEMYAEK